MKQETITKIRRAICTALEDIGGVNTRLREIEDGLVVGTEENEIIEWLESACEILTDAGTAIKEEIQS
jgi:hypothetical protein